jgi:hypothetical protein
LNHRMVRINNNVRRTVIIEYPVKEGSQKVRSIRAHFISAD